MDNVDTKIETRDCQSPSPPRSGQISGKKQKSGGGYSSSKRHEYEVKSSNSTYEIIKAKQPMKLIESDQTSIYNKVNERVKRILDAKREMPRFSVLVHGCYKRRKMFGTTSTLNRMMM